MVSNIPKPLAPVAGRPFLAFLLDHLAQKGFSRAVLSVGHMSDKVMAQFGDEYAGMQLRYSVEVTPLGTGGALRLALFQCAGEFAFALNGDTFVDFDVEDMVATWRRYRAPVVVARRVTNTERYGRLKVIERRIVSITEKDVRGPGLVNAGCYLFPTDLLHNYSSNASFSLETDFLVHAVRRRPFFVTLSTGRFIDIGTPDDYARAEAVLAGGIR